MSWQGGLGGLVDVVDVDDVGDVVDVADPSDDEAGLFKAANYGDLGDVW